jgi:tRNA threonylcarbamoyladenosine biosynthesis protein TsaE
MRLASMNSDKREPVMDRWEFTLADETATQALGHALGQVLAPGEHLYLSGDLGVGKTTLTRSIAQSYGVTDLNTVASPTYAYAHSYEGSRGLLHHLDFYRLSDLLSAISLGLEDLLQDAAAPCLIEWAERVPELMIENALRLNLRREAGSTLRYGTLSIPAARAQAYAQVLPPWLGTPVQHKQRGEL